MCIYQDDERGERVGRRQWYDPDRETQYAEQVCCVTSFHLFAL